MKFNDRCHVWRIVPDEIPSQREYPRGSYVERCTVCKARITRDADGKVIAFTDRTYRGTTENTNGVH